MTDAEREELIDAHASQDFICLCESRAADKANDSKAVWEWLAMADLPAHILLFLKSQNGAKFIRDMGFSTKNADEEYGPEWLDKGVVIGGHHF
ncbi:MULTISPECIES: hypothetical protein [unclassified Bartonella]|uniref:hypothetical protein n=1 Tax=unclassified Bartonella TaxID=2645622 RepID=UPI00099A2BCB|nr:MULTISPECIES: hypothetical protein [unclassified Bartonella]AQX17982.1 hypothetical protein BA1379B_001350 [Bartonella sp. A1379B]AQX22495.1 hypothetical protein Bho11B_004730 [Bartonella sp. 11B]AQX24223.1 hypothetical protein Bho114_009040 [Bartonella sp. 114]AQX24944.1 hypothetical protein Bco22_002470 [Bartonella sp. Coyote22sub2]